MINYLIKRILLFIPTLFVIILLTFILSKLAPGDPVEQMLGGVSESGGQLADRKASERIYRETRQKLGLDLPVFYFSLSSAAVPDTLYKIEKKQHRYTLSRLIDNYGNWPLISQYYNLLGQVEHNAFLLNVNEELYPASKNIYEEIQELFLAYNENEIQAHIKNIEAESTYNKGFEDFNKDVKALQTSFLKISQNPAIYKNYIPAFHFYGFNNQFHHWMVNVFQGNFGKSYQDKRPVKSVLKEAIKWTLLLNICAIIIAYLISIPVGVYTARHSGKFPDRFITILLFVLYSLPTFWIATLLIIFFGGGDYLAIFPESGITDLPSAAPFWERFRDIAYHLVLPVFCLTYVSFAFISRQMRAAMLNSLSHDYIRTARAKGLPENKVIWKHAFRNSLIPLITLFAAVFPAAVSGSVVIEGIFSIPGMGQKSWFAVLARDFPVIFAVLTISAILTLVGNLIADILYAFTDPRISFTKKA